MNRSRAGRRDNVIGSLQVQRFELENGWTHLVIAFPPGSGSDLHRWGVIQHVKAQAVGPEREAFELFPAERRAITEGNERHLYVLPEGVHLPVGITAAGVRAWGEKHKPPQDVGVPA